VSGKGPLFLIGDSAQSLWHDTPDGDLVVDVDGTICVFTRNGPGGSFLFDHDTLHEKAKDGTLTDVRRDGQGNFLAFKTGPVAWTVGLWNRERDVYACMPVHRTEKKRLVVVPAGVKLSRKAHRKLHGKR
jgi:hypothetical protein